jgi:hypothetical protein
MVQVTTPAITVELPNETAQALWAAMHEDDDLAEDYVNACVIHGLNHLIEDIPHTSWSDAELAKLFSNLFIARQNAMDQEKDVAQRWSSYCEPPF